MQNQTLSFYARHIYAKRVLKHFAQKQEQEQTVFSKKNFVTY